jgi:hypothetical protein
MQKVKFSPEKYIRANAAILPIEKCLIADLYKNQGLTSCIIIKKQLNGKFMFATFLVDRMCLGIKNTIVNCNFDNSQLEDFISKMQVSQGKFKEVSTIYFNNLLFAAIDYAAELGFNPPKDYLIAQCFLDENLVDDGIDEIEMGWEGKPFFIQGPFDDGKRILAKLNASVGEGNYEFVVEGSNFL